MVTDRLSDVSDHPRTDHGPVPPAYPNDTVRGHMIRAVAAEYRRRSAGGVHAAPEEHAEAFVDIALAAQSQHTAASTVDP